MGASHHVVGNATGESPGIDQPAQEYRQGDEALAGWIGGHHVFSRVWELHPLVVARMAQKQGVGRALVANLERIAAARGAIMTLILGSDDAFLRHDRGSSR